MTVWVGRDCELKAIRGSINGRSSIVPLRTRNEVCSHLCGSGVDGALPSCQICECRIARLCARLQLEQGITDGRRALWSPVSGVGRYFCCSRSALGPQEYHLDDNDTRATAHPGLFSLEVEGAEALVLSTIDFQAVRIHVLMIEIHSHFCKDDACKSRQPVRAKMAVEGYHRYEDVIPASDMYVHPDSLYQISDAVATPNR